MCLRESNYELNYIKMCLVWVGKHKSAVTDEVEINAVKNARQTKNHAID